MKKKGSSSRFPVARIKKIMQADEDVGKVAQATPLLVSKAVEMFMESLVRASVYQAQNRGSRKVQAYHLKQAVMVTEAFDFLKDIVERIPDPTTTAEEDLKPSKPKPSSSRAKRTKKTKVEEEQEEQDEDGDEDEEMDAGGSNVVPTNDCNVPIEEEEEDDEEYY